MKTITNSGIDIEYVGHIAAYRQTRSPGRLAWSEGRRPSGAGLRTSDEPGEFSQWLSRNDSTINIAIRISIIIIIDDGNENSGTSSMKGKFRRKLAARTKTKIREF